MDSQALVRARAGDREAMGELLAELMVPAHRLAHGLLQDSAEAEDAVQEAAIKAWRKLDRLRPGTELRPWFFGIVANQCRNRTRSRWWSVAALNPDSKALSGPDSTDRPDIVMALRRLDHTSRLIVVARFYMDLSIAEIAGMTSLPLGTVKSRLSRSLAKMRPGLELREDLK